MQRWVLEQPSLAGRPAVLHADERGVKRVRFASGAAQQRGIRAGQTLAAASALEPSLARRQLQVPAEAAALHSLGERLLSLAPGFQTDAPEGLWLDASASALSGDEARWGERVLACCREAALVARCVVGSERFTTRALARWRRDALAVVPERGGSAFPTLPLAALESGWLGADAVTPLRALGLSTLGELAGLPTGALVARFGALGLATARLCRGEDDSRFAADALPEIFEESSALDWPAEALEPVLFALKSAIDRLCARLQGRRQAAVRLTVTLGLERGAPLTVPLVLARPSSEARLLVELIRHRLLDATVREPITSLTVRVDEAGRDAGRQLELGGAPVGEAALEVVLSRLQSALGEEALFLAEPVAHHRPEAGWAPRRFSPPDAGVGPPSPFSAPPSQPSFQSGEGETLPLAAEVAPDWPETVAAEEAPRLRLVDAEAVVVETSADSEAPPGVTSSDEAALEAAARALVLAEGALPSPPRWPKRRAKVALRPEVLSSTAFARPPRLLETPLRLQVEQAADGRLVSVRVAGRQRAVRALWGPERLCGDWWAPQPFARDYYRVDLDGVGPLWVFRDGRDGAFYAQGVFD